jgi:hypothetical protein
MSAKRVTMESATDDPERRMAVALTKTLQEITRLRGAIAAHKQAMSEYKGATYDLELWRALDAAH